jgi:hypothetical protein
LIPPHFRQTVIATWSVESTHTESTTMPKLLPGCLAAVVVIAAHLALAAPPSESSEQNVRESEQYERLLCTNAAFRQRRIAQECGPLQGSQFYDSCVATFQCGGAPARRSNRPPPSETIR